MDVLETVINHLPSKKRQTSGGWMSFNAVCCHHRGHSHDKRGRGGLIIHDGGFSYSCFNCSFKTSWIPGKSLSQNNKSFLSYLGLTENQIQHINFELLKSKGSSNGGVSKKQIIRSFKKVNLPNGSKPLEYWLNNPTNDFLKVLNYLLSRDEQLLYLHEYYYSDDPQYKNRLIIPFFSHGEIVGYTARLGFQLKKNEVRYLTQGADGILFNGDVLDNPLRKIVTVCEGIFDAIAIDGVACMKQTLSDKQIQLLENSEKTVVIVPDRDNSGKKLVEQALELGYTVAFPEWCEGIKDCADAVKKYGRLFTVSQILNSTESSSLKIKLKAKLWFK